MSTAAASSGAQRSARRRRPNAAAGSADVVPIAGAAFELTDLGNMDRFVAQTADDVRYVTDMAQWLNWTGTYWRMDYDRAATMQQAMNTVRSMRSQAASPEFRGDQRAVIDWSKKSESRPRLEAILALAYSAPQLRIPPTDLDTDLMLLGVRNGTLDLRTGELRPADRGDLITQQVSTEYDPDATCPLWMKTIKRILPEPEMQGFLQRAVGYTLTGSTAEQVLFLCNGRGANGKSLVVETLSALMGDYAQKAPPELLMSKPNTGGDAPSPELARLRGVRFSAAVETEEGRRLAESRVKELTGGDTVTARHLHKGHFSFKPVCKLWLVTNHRPKIVGTDEGIWRRILTVPFTQYIEYADRDKRLAEKLRGELPGILAWAVRGCLDWQQRGENLDVPAAIWDANRSYRAEQDILGSFLADKCVVREGVSVPSTSLYREYQEWCRDNGHQAMSQTSFGIKLADKGFGKIKRSVIYWKSIGLRSDLPAGDDEAPADFAENGPSWQRVPDFAADLDPEPTILPLRHVDQDADPDDGPVLAEEQAPSTPPAEAPPVLDTCRVCGLPCDPVCNGVHINCGPDTNPDDGPDDAPEDPQDGPGGGGSPLPGPTPTDPRPAAQDAAEPVDAAVVTIRRRRPWTPKSTAFVTWSSGTGVDDAGAEVRVPARARVGAFLAALPPDVQRVVLVGAMPGKTGPGLQDWVTDDLEDGWTEAGAGHYLDPDALAARYQRPDGGEVHVHRLASWVRDTTGTIRPDTARSAFALLRNGLGEVFGRRRVIPGQRTEDDPQCDALAPAILSSPASTGRELLLRTLPAGHQYPVLDEHLELLHHTTGQGRNELFTEDRAQYPADELPGLYSYDMRWAYAALCRGVTGTGPATLDNGSEFLGYAPARYEVEFTVPDGWEHLGLLGVHGEGWPSTPGTSWRTWCDARELRLADRWGWRIGQDVRITRRLRLSTDKSAPLRTWADKLTEVRETWLPAQEAPAAVIRLAQDMTRTVLLASLGALQGRRQKITHALPQARAAEIPTGATPTVAGGMLVWQTETAAGWREMVHPEWVGQVWAEQRCRLLDTGPNAAQANVGALHLPRRELVALRTDAVYSTTDPGWPDSGRVGQFRPQLHLNRPVLTPRCLDELMSLRTES